MEMPQTLRVSALPFANTASNAVVSPPSHAVQFYEEDGRLIEALGTFIAEGLLKGDRCLVVATGEHRCALEQRLQARGLDVEAARARGAYLSREASELLSTFMVDGMPDETRFMEAVGGLVAQLVDRSPLRVFGEMVALLYAAGNASAASQVEGYWNNLGRALPFTLLCAYPLGMFARSVHQPAFTAICQQHDHVTPGESYGDLATHDDRLRAIAELQQQAIALRAEIEERKKAEEAVRRREEELADILENSLQGIHRVGPDGTILWANRAELNLLGYEADDYIGHHISEFHVDSDVITDLLDRLSAGEGVYDYPARLRCKDGTIKHVLIHSNVLFEDGRFIHTRCFTRDITEQKRAEGEIRRLNEILNQKVEELQDKIRDLELFHDVAVSRELKMMELEEENKALKLELARLKAAASSTMSAIRPASDSPRP